MSLTRKKPKGEGVYLGAGRSLPAFMPHYNILDPMISVVDPSRMAQLIPSALDSSSAKRLIKKIDETKYTRRELK